MFTGSSSSTCRGTAMETLVSNREGRSRGKLPPARGFVKVKPAEISPCGGGGLLVRPGLGRGRDFGPFDRGGLCRDGFRSLFIGCRHVGLLDDWSQRGDLLALAHPHDDHALGRAAEALDLLARNPDHRSAG